MNRKLKTIFLSLPLLISFSGIVHSQIDSTYQDTVFFPIVTNYNKDSFIDYDIMPEFSGGKDAMNNYIISNTNYPPSAIKDSISGLIILAFVVDTNGSVTKIRILQSLREDIDNECIRMVQEMPKWKPGSTVAETKKGYYRKVIPIHYTLRLNFTLGKVEKKKGITITPKS